MLHELVGSLFAAGLDLHRALEHLDPRTEPSVWVHSAVARLDAAITTVLRAGLAHATNTPRRTPTTIDTFDALTSGLTGGFDLVAHLRTIIDPAIVAQAERMLAERHHTSIAEAVSALTACAHRHGRGLPDVARAVIDGTVDLSDSDILAGRV